MNACGQPNRSRRIKRLRTRCEVAFLNTRPRSRGSHPGGLQSAAGIDNPAIAQAGDLSGIHGDARAARLQDDGHVTPSGMLAKRRDLRFLRELPETKATK